MSDKSKILLVLQFACFGYFIFFQRLLAPGILMLVQFLGFLLCIWSMAVMGIGNFNAQPEVKKGARLIQIGPYSKIRNPMYAGLILLFGGGLMGNFNWPGLMVLLLLVIIFILKILDEEKYLLERFGDSYKQYMTSTHRLIPHVF